jgi:hypothetical protein
MPERQARSPRSSVEITPDPNGITFSGRIVAPSTVAFRPLSGSTSGARGLFSRYKETVPRFHLGEWVFRIGRTPHDRKRDALADFVRHFWTPSVQQLSDENRTESINIKCPIYRTKTGTMSGTSANVRRVTDQGHLGHLPRRGMSNGPCDVRDRTFFGTCPGWVALACLLTIATRFPKPLGFAPGAGS